MKIVLFLNGTLGFRILDLLTQNQEHAVDRIYLNSQERQSKNFAFQVKNLLESKNLKVPIFTWSVDSEQIENSIPNSEEKLVGISVLFGHVLPENLINSISGGILNLHPSLLPIGRGSDPIPWSIIEKKKQGITIHLIDEGLDTGNIIFQKEIPTSLNMSAGDIYELASNELFAAFSIIFEKWIKGECPNFPQNRDEVTQHTTSELFKLKVFQEDEVATFGEFVRRLQATTFSDGRLPTLRDNQGNLWEIKFGITSYQIRGDVTGAR